MNMTQAKNAVQPFLTVENSKVYMEQTDQMLWVEENIFGPAGISASVCSNFGKALCDYCEDRLEGQLVDEY